MSDFYMSYWFYILYRAGEISEYLLILSSAALVLLFGILFFTMRVNTEKENNLLSKSIFKMVYIIIITSCICCISPSENFYKMITGDQGQDLGDLYLPIISDIQDPNQDKQNIKINYMREN